MNRCPVSFFLLALTGLMMFLNTACSAGGPGQRLKERIQERRAEQAGRGGIRQQAEPTAPVAGGMVFQGRPYLLHIPSNVEQGRKLPLVVVLHGGLGSAETMRARLGMDAVADKHRFMVAYVNGQEGRRRIARNMRSWNAGGGCCGPAAQDNSNDVGYLEGFIREMIAKYPADPERIYLVGHSNGAMMSYRFACERPGVVAAIVAVSGPLMIDRCNAQQGLHVLHIHGTLDEHVPVAGGHGGKSKTENVNFRSVAETERIMKAAGANFTLKLVPGADHSVDRISQALAASEGLNLAETVARFLNGKTRASSARPTQ